jgi:hypothetical protein
MKQAKSKSPRVQTVGSAGNVLAGTSNFKEGEREHNELSLGAVAARLSFESIDSQSVWIEIMGHEWPAERNALRDSLMANIDELDRVTKRPATKERRKYFDRKMSTAGGVEEWV